MKTAFYNQIKIKLSTYIFLVMGLSLSVTSCKTKRGSELSPEDQCTNSNLHSWSDGSCQTNEAIALKQAEAKCISDSDYTWLNKECVEKDSIETPRESCEENNGAYWTVDPETKKGTCISPESLVSQRDACLEKEKSGFKWDLNRCLSPEGQTCIAGGDAWNDEKGCIGKEQQACIDLHDGSQWLGDHCAGTAELSCLAQGARFAWETTSGAGSCGFKQFISYCNDASSAPDSIKHTVNMILDLEEIDTTNCVEADEKLKNLTILDLRRLEIEDIYPLYNLQNLTKIYLDGNQVADLTPLINQINLEVLSLAENQVMSIEPLSNLKLLKTLVLSDNEVSDLSPLATLSKLESLYLKSNKISEIDSLVSKTEYEVVGGLDQLKQIDLTNNCGLLNADGLAKLRQLQFLFLDKTSVTTLPSFRGVVDLYHSTCE